jgi:hypothetical protein
MVDNVFQWCVDHLMWLAAATGTTYKQINVIIFCIIWPLLTVGLAALCLTQWAQIRKLRSTLQDTKGRELKTRDHG